VTWRAPILFKLPAFRPRSIRPIPLTPADRPDPAAPLRGFVHGALIGGLAIAAFRRSVSTSRASYVDVNREPHHATNSDPRSSLAGLPSFANTRSSGWPAGSARFPRGSATARKLPRAAFANTLSAGSRRCTPYHRALRRLINRRIRPLGPGWWGIATRCRRAGVSRDEAAPPRRVGDRYGIEWCAAVALHGREDHEPLGYSIVRNKPYAGGFITEHYGNPASRLQCHPARTHARSTWHDGGASVTEVRRWRLISGAVADALAAMRWRSRAFPCGGGVKRFSDPFPPSCPGRDDVAGGAPE